jgi:hypothetical protein
MGMIGSCGLDCTSCPAYIAGKTGDRALQEKTAASWTTGYGAEVKPEDIACDGCQSSGPRLFSHCAVCNVRQCTHNKGFATCAECGDYAGCKTISEFFGFCPEAKTTLDGLRAK